MLRVCLSYRYKTFWTSKTRACCMIQNNRLWVLMSRRLSGEATPSEAEELQQLLEQSPQKQHLLDILHSYFTVLPAGLAEPGLEDTDLETRFRKIVDSKKIGLED